VSQYGMTPLHAAAIGGHLEVARLLLEVGADITAKDEVGERRVGGDGQRIRESIDFGEL